MVVSIWLVLALALVGGVAWALRPVRTTGPISPSEAWIAATGHARRVSLLAWCVLIPVPLAVLALSTPYLQGLTLGAITAALPSLAGVGFVVVHLVGELTWPRPAGPVRRAPLVRRRIRDITPRALAALTCTWLALLGFLLVLCGAVAGTGGRSLSYAQVDGSVSTMSPFPGWYYGRFIGVPMVVLVAGCIAVLALVARRPAVADTDPAADATLRRTSARRVLAGVQLMVAWTLTPCVFVAANAVRGVDPRWADAFGPGSARALAATAAVAAVVIALTAAVVALRCSRAPAAGAATVPVLAPPVTA